MARLILIEETVRKGNYDIYYTVDNIMDREPHVLAVAMVDYLSESAVVEVSEDFDIKTVSERRSQQTFTELNQAKIDALIPAIKASLTAKLRSK